MSGGGWPVLHGLVELHADALPRGPLPNPIRSLIVGDPAGEATCWGCVIDLDDDGELHGGLRAPARLLFWQPQHPAPPGPVPIWYHRVIGQVSRLQLVDAGRLT